MFWKLEIGLLLLCSLAWQHSECQLQVGFYTSTCPNAEFIVASEVEKATEQNPRTPAILLRLHNHDCFVQGCDASVLIRFPDSPSLEYKSPNHAGLQGFEVIDNIKAKLEEECPGIVSCADILAMAARDSIALANGPRYSVPTGRRDGLISDILDASLLPEVTDSLQVLMDKFADKGLSGKDFVVLTAAHTIGDAACFFVTDRLYNFPNGGSDPLISSNFLPELKQQCPQDGPNNKKIPLDNNSNNVFDTHIFQNIKNGFAVIRSDAILYTDESTKAAVDFYLGTPSAFLEDFVNAIVKMGTIDIKISSQGEIRQKCSMFN